MVHILLAHEGIEECGFAHIMPSNNSEEDPLLGQLFVEFGPLSLQRELAMLTQYAQEVQSSL